MANPTDDNGQPLPNAEREDTGAKAVRQTDAECQPPPIRPAPSGRGKGLRQHHTEERRDAKLAIRAIQNGWPVTAGARRDVIRAARRLVRNGTPKEQGIGGRLILAADQLNARREETAAADSRADTQAGLAALRAVLASPEGLKTLQAASAAPNPALPCPDASTAIPEASTAIPEASPPRAD
jgi:hypothetical protein